MRMEGQKGMHNMLVLFVSLLLEVRWHGDRTFSTINNGFTVVAGHGGLVSACQKLLDEEDDLDFVVFGSCDAGVLYAHNM